MYPLSVPLNWQLQTCTLLTANTPAAVGDLYRFATRDASSALEVRLDVAAKMREAALKSSIFIGVPRVRFHIFSIPVQNLLKFLIYRNPRQFCRWKP